MNPSDFTLTPARGGDSYQEVGGLNVLNVKLWGRGNEMILYFCVQLVENLGGLSPHNLKSGRA